MTLRSQVKEKISFFSGQKSGLPPNTLQPSDSQIISNFVLQQGNLQKINGTTLYHVDTNSSGEFLWLERLNDRWIFQRGSLVSFEDSEDAKTFTIIDANYGSNKIFSAKWRDRAYLVNGDRYRSFDGTDIRKVGLLPPEEGVSPRASINISLVAGGSVDDGAHKYVITLFDSVTQTESLPNGSLVGDNGLFNTQEFDAVNNKSGWTPSTLTTGSSDNTVKFNNIGAFTDDIRNVASSRVDRYRIYRTKVGNSVDYFLVTENNIGTLDFSDTIADSALTDLLITDFKTPPPSTRGVTLGSVTTPSVLQDVNIIRVWRDQIQTLEEGSSINGEIDPERGFNEASVDADVSQDTASEQGETSSTDKSEGTPGVNWTSEDIPQAYRDNYKEFQAQYTRGQQELADTKRLMKDLESNSSSHKTKAEQFDQLDSFLRNNPEKNQAFQEMIGAQQPVDPILKEDPMFQRSQALESRMVQLESALSDNLKSQQDASINATVDREIASARNTLTKMFGENPSNADMKSVIQKMNEAKVYDGGLVARAMFQDKYVDSRVQSALKDQRAKKSINLGGSAMNSFRAANEEGSMTLKESFAQSLNELNL